MAPCHRSELRGHKLEDIHIATFKRQQGDLAMQRQPQLILLGGQNMRAKYMQASTQA